MTHTLHFGRRFAPVLVNGIPGASMAYAERRDESGEGASTFPLADVRDATGRIVGHLSYNGKVWARPSRDWQPGDQPIYDPFAAEAAA